MHFWSSEVEWAIWSIESMRKRALEFIFMTIIISLMIMMVKVTCGRDIWCWQHCQEGQPLQRPVLALQGSKTWLSLWYKQSKQFKDQCQNSKDNVISMIQTTLKILTMVVNEDNDVWNYRVWILLRSWGLNILIKESIG